MKSVDLENAYPHKSTDEPFDDYFIERGLFDKKGFAVESERASGHARRRIEEYLEKKRLRELLQEEVLDDVFH